MTGYKKVYLNPLNIEKGAYFLTGNEMLARAALVSGVIYFASYPGSPITGVSEVMMKARTHFKGLHSEYSINEAAAVQGAIGASWSGARALITMKHVGMHVSSDPIAYLGYTGTVGGLILAVGTDPGANCSTGEFDVRHLNDSFHWIMFEPSNVSDVYKYTIEGFKLSEKWQMPVLMIMPSELCNQYGTVTSEGITFDMPFNSKFIRKEKYINNGSSAIAHHTELLSKVNAISKESDSFLRVDNLGSCDTAIITTGCNYPAVNEALGMLGLNNITVISPGMTYPLPQEGLINALKNIKTLLIAEELDGYLSKHILAFVKKNGINLAVKSLNSDFLCAGALTMEKLSDALAKEFKVQYKSHSTGINYSIPERPGTFCPGCPHRGILYTLKRVCGEKGVYGGDIGCSSLPPYYSDWLTCMGSGVGIAHGVATVTAENGRVYSSMGDSTFFHCGISMIINSIQQETDITILLLDNRWTAMTGHQPLPHTANAQISIPNIVKALGAKNVWEVDAYSIKAFRDTLAESNEVEGVKIIIVKGECRLKYMEKTHERLGTYSCRIVEDMCHQCGECYKVLGCPAIKYEDDTYRIDEEICGKCGICAQVCPNNSISYIEYIGVADSET